MSKDPALQQAAGTARDFLRDAGINLPFNTALELIARLAKYKDLHHAQVARAKVVQTSPAFVLVQEGGSSSELYLHSWDSKEEAEEDRINCARDGAYRTSPVVEIPAALAAHGEDLYSVIEAVLDASKELECPEVPEAELTEEQEEALRKLTRDQMVIILEGAGIQCYDSETKEVLAEALRVNILDDTIPDSCLYPED